MNRKVLLPLFLLERTTVTDLYRFVVWSPYDWVCALNDVGFDFRIVVLGLCGLDLWLISSVCFGLGIVWFLVYDCVSDTGFMVLEIPVWLCWWMVLMSFDSWCWWYWFFVCCDFSIVVLQVFNWWKIVVENWWWSWLILFVCFWPPFYDCWVCVL